MGGRGTKAIMLDPVDIPKILYPLPVDFYLVLFLQRSHSYVCLLRSKWMRFLALGTAPTTLSSGQIGGRLRLEAWPDNPIAQVRI